MVISEKSDDTYHQAQRQHIYSIYKNTLEKLEIVTEASDKYYTLGTNGPAVIYCNGNLSDFISVEMDGLIVDSSNYILSGGSTVMTLNATYMETLAVGEHIVTLNYSKAGSINTSLTVLESNSGKSSERAA